MKNKKIYLIIAIAVIVIALGVYFFLPSSGSTQFKLDTVKVKKDSIATAITATGTLEPIKEVDVGTQVSGVISKIYVDYNSTVKKGQILAELDKKLLQAELANAKATLQIKQVALENEELTYKRQKGLWKQQAISKADWETAQADYQTAKLNVTTSQAAVIQAETNLGYATIYSTIDGVVISREVEEGQTVASSYSTPTLFTIANDLTKMRVIADVDETDIGGVKDGQHVTFTVSAYSDKIFEGTVVQVRKEATTESNVVTYEVVIDAPNPEKKLMPGMTASVSIYTIEKNGVTAVAAKAFRFTPEEKVVKQMKDFTFSKAVEAKKSGQKVAWIKSGNKVTAKVVTIGLTDGIKTEIKEGLSVGDEVVTSITEISDADMQAASGDTESSPFMPQHPGKKKK